MPARPFVPSPLGKPPASEAEQVCHLIAQDPSTTSVRYQTGAAIRTREPTDQFSIVLEGAVAIESLRRAGRRITLEIAGPGACLPPVAAPGGPGRLALRAMRPTVVARVPRTTFARIAGRRPDLASLVGEKLVTQHLALLEHLATLAEPALRPRVAAAVLYLGRAIGVGCPLADGQRIMVPQTVVAEVADVSRQTANQILRDFQSLGLVRIERSLLCVRDAAGISAIASGAAPEATWEPCGACALVNRGVALTCFPLTAAQRSAARRS
ncbi:MAG TPA: Crp/Fnr family transcriptional regulator [Gemmatimonadaceae bacterium]|nr:Crp/Fnr family transcriptional regulator [Gemmatimonadaceae bacterium]